MGLIDGTLRLLFGEGRNVLRDTAGAFWESPEAEAARDAARQRAALDQFAAEFAGARRSAFDRLIDGVNRLSSGAGAWHVGAFRRRDGRPGLVRGPHERDRAGAGAALVAHGRDYSADLGAQNRSPMPTTAFVRGALVAVKGAWRVSSVRRNRPWPSPMSNPAPSSHTGPTPPVSNPKPPVP